jgi:hypothetical protein
MNDYGIYYRRAIGVARLDKELPQFDIFISAFNSSDRVNEVFARIRAVRKFWFVQPEYQYSPLDLPQGITKIAPTSIDEVAQANALLAEIGDLNGKSICIDITGFMRHLLAYLIARLKAGGILRFYALYSEPVAYIQQEQTAFSTKTSGVVRPVRGMASSMKANAEEALIIGVGFDSKLISQVASSKDAATVFPVFAFPSLSPDMYQQSAVRSSAAGDVALASSWTSKRRFAPANDPFSTAGVVSAVVRELDRNGRDWNVYLSPLATKVQVLGFTFYWLLEGSKRTAVSMLLPECLTYSRETTQGLRRLWMYELDFT